MKRLLITFGNNSYNLKFGFGCFRFLAEKWGLEGFPEVLEKVLKISETIDKMRFNDLQLIIDVIYGAVYANGVVSEIDSFNDDDCGDFLLSDPEKIAQIFEALAESMPKLETGNSEDLGKPKTVRKAKNSLGTITK